MEMISLQRGVFKTSADFKVINAYCSEQALDFCEENTAVIYLDARKNIYLCESQTRRSLPVRQTRCGYCTEFKSKIIHFSILPYYESVDLNMKNTFNVPAYGLRENLWYDGPIFHSDGEAKILSYVPCGFRARLLLENFDVKKTSVGDEFQLEAKNIGLHRSLVSLSKFLFSETGSAPIFLSAFDLKHAIALVGLVQAFYGRRFQLQSELHFHEWPSTWKRLIQNLNLDQYEIKTGANRECFDLEKICSFVPDNVVGDIALAVNRRSDVIPRSMLG